MEKPVVKASKAKMILKLMPNIIMSFQSLQPFSPSRDKRGADCNNGFSGPMVSIIPVEARRKSGGMEQEPSSPKVSCIGQIKYKKKQLAKHKRQHQKIRSDENEKQLPTKKDYARSLTIASPFQDKTSSNSGSSVIGKIFHGRRSDASADKSRLREDDAPSLGQMKRFASGRETLLDFNWTTPSQVVPKYYLDNDYEEKDDEEIIIPFSAPILTNIIADPHGSTTLPLEPRKEINLWKRRTMAQPKPLQIN